MYQQIDESPICIYTIIMMNEKELNINHVVDIVMIEHKVRLFMEHFNLNPHTG